MSAIEVRNGTQIEKYEYFREDFDTFIVHSDDIDLSQEGFTLKTKETYRNTVISKDVYTGIPTYQYEYKSNIVEKKYKLVKKENVIRHYHDWSTSSSYFYGEYCSYEERDGFIHLEMFSPPKWLKSKLKFYDYYAERGEYHFDKHRQYYIDIPYDDVRFQRDVIRKFHDDYEINTQEIAKATNDEARKQLIIEYVVNKFLRSHSIRELDFSPLFLGTYGYKIPDKLYSTDIDLVFDKIIPRIYEIELADKDYDDRYFSRGLSYGIGSYGSAYKSEDYFRGKIWFEDGKRVYPSEDYSFYMYIKVLLKLMEKHKNLEYPYILTDLEYTYHHLKSNSETFLTRHNPVYWNDKVVCDDLGNYVEEALKELIYFKRFDGFLAMRRFRKNVVDKLAK
ncbi:MAG: hypothetical protein NC313_12470 [Butyrivibrio sp.]|nr:hypothetical protein [Butyrivibrio sp.]